jgi:Zn-dependent M28 family amino/carboxypeptidase
VSGRVLILLLLLACAATAGAASPPEFDGAAALRHVERLVALGPRPAGSDAAARARAYITAELKKVGVTGEVRPFRAQTPQGAVAMANVVAVLKGRRPEVIMIAGHYDTKVFKAFRFVGANDGGSSAALLIELARRLAAMPREYTYWVVWFDGEEAVDSWTERDSLYGSRHLAAELQRGHQLPSAMVLVDMIGDRDLLIRRESASASWLTDIVWSSAARLGYGSHFHSDTIPVEDDHVPFVRAGVPSALLIDFDYPPWHTADDTVDKLSARSLSVVGEVLLDALPCVEHYLSRSPAGVR